MSDPTPIFDDDHSSLSVSGSPAALFAAAAASSPTRSAAESAILNAAADHLLRISAANVAESFTWSMDFTLHIAM
jgi:hypothetical protein